MSKKMINEMDVDLHKKHKSQDTSDTSNGTHKTKLERRRRIEDINEEKRLREELNVF